MTEPIARAAAAIGDTLIKRTTSEILERAARAAWQEEFRKYNAAYDRGEPWTRPTKELPK